MAVMAVACACRHHTTSALDDVTIIKHVWI